MITSLDIRLQCLEPNSKKKNKSLSKDGGLSSGTILLLFKYSTEYYKNTGKTVILKKWNCMFSCRLPDTQDNRNAWL